MTVLSKFDQMNAKKREEKIKRIYIAKNTEQSKIY